MQGQLVVKHRLFYVNDETLGEDRCRVRRGHGAPMLAAFRNVVVHLLEQVKAAATRRLSAHPREVLLLSRYLPLLGNGAGFSLDIRLIPSFASRAEKHRFSAQRFFRYKGYTN